MGDVKLSDTGASYYPPALQPGYMGADPPLKTTTYESGRSYFQNYRNEHISRMQMTHNEWGVINSPYTPHPDATVYVKSQSKYLRFPQSQISMLDAGRQQEVDDFYLACQMHRDQYKDHSKTLHPLDYFKTADYMYQCPRDPTSVYLKYPEYYTKYKDPLVLPLTLERSYGAPSLPKRALTGIYNRSSFVVTSMRMSELTAESILSAKEDSSSALTSRSISQQSVSSSSNTKEIINQSEYETNGDLLILNNNGEYLDLNNKSNLAKFPESEDSLNLKKSPTILKSLEKLQIDNTGSHDSVFSAPNQSPLLPKAGKTSKTKIIMGRRALLRAKSGDLEVSPGDVVHELVTDKYHDKLSHYIGRMYHRRISRDSRNTDDDDASSNYSATSLSTIGTPESLYDGKSYFSLLCGRQSEQDLDFLKSTDDFNKDTTTDAGTFLDSTINSVEGKNVSTDLEYDPKKFLKDALGDVSFDTRSLDFSLNSKPKDVDSANISALISKAGSLYSSVRKSIRRACSFKERGSEDASVKNKYRNKDRKQPSDEGTPVECLMRELYIQNGIIFQVSKALNYCRNTKDITSPEYIEAEKILLVACCTKEAIQSSLDSIEFGEKERSSLKSFGTVEISNIVYYLKGDAATELSGQKNFTEHFVIVVTNEKSVLSSKVLVADKNGEIKADKKFRITGLSTSFEISVALYSTKIKRMEKNHLEYAKSKKKENKAPCPSPRSFFHLHHKSSHRNLMVDNVLSIKPSSFTLCGSCTIRCSDFGRTHFRMHHVPLSSSLEGYFTASLSREVKLINHTSGFLTIGTEDGACLWNRRWCVLEGPLLKYWNYPTEEFSAEPFGIINLENATEEVTPADRSICPRPKSLFLIIKNGEHVLKYFLSADSLPEKQNWHDELNFVIRTLSAWS